MKSILKRIVLKLTSMKNIITIWSVCAISFIIVAQPALETLAITLAAIPVAYFAANSYQHHLDSK